MVSGFNHSMRQPILKSNQGKREGDGHEIGPVTKKSIDIASSLATVDVGTYASVITDPPSTICSLMSILEDRSFIRRPELFAEGYSTIQGWRRV